MKKLILLISVIVLVSLFLILKPSFTRYSVYDNEVVEKIRLGYCLLFSKIHFSKLKKYAMTRPVYSN